MSRKFEIPRVIITGRGSHAELKNLALLDGKKHALLICDDERVDTEVEEHIKLDLQTRGIKLLEFREATTQVNTDQLEHCHKILNEKDIDLVIAIGGKGAIQLGKLFAFMATNPGAIEDFAGENTGRNPSLPMVAVAMTAGSGAAISHCACFINKQNLYRFSICDQFLMPEVAILDPGLKAWQPPQEIASDGMTSLSHAIESITSPEATPVTDACALSAITLICKWLPVAYAHGHDLDAREKLMYAQQLVSMAASNSSRSTLCRLSAQIEAFVHIKFGYVMSALLPHMLDYCSESIPERVEMIRDALERTEFTPRDSDLRLQASELLRRFIQRLDIPLQLSFEGLEKEHIETVKKTLDGDHYGLPTVHPNPMDTMINILHKAL